MTKCQYLPFDDVIVSHCELCDKPLNCNEVYGPEGFDLCRDHHTKFAQLEYFILYGKLISIDELETMKPLEQK